MKAPYRFPRTLLGWKRLFWLSLYCCPIHRSRLSADWPQYDDGSGYCFKCDGVSMWKPGFFTVLRHSAIAVARKTEARNEFIAPMPCDNCEHYLLATPTRLSAEKLLEALESLVLCNEEWNTAVEGVIGRPAGWNDDYLHTARAAIAQAKGK